MNEYVEVKSSARRVYTAHEVASILGIATSTVYEYALTGQIPALRIGSKWVFPKRRFDEWLDADAAKDQAVI